MELIWEILKTIAFMTVVILIALTPSVDDNLYYERLKRRRIKKNNKNNATKFFKNNK